METYVIVIIIVLVLLVMFLGAKQIGNGNSTANAARYPSNPSQLGGGCGR